MAISNSTGGRFEAGERGLGEAELLCDRVKCVSREKAFLSAPILVSLSENGFFG